jgi:hypothetical protein
LNRVSAPDIDDDGVYTALADNTRVKSFPDLQVIERNILKAYAEYVASEGNAHLVTSLGISEKHANFLKHHYGSPPTCLSHISNLRNSTDHKCCPMCGSLHCGTLDHLFPKEDFPEFSVFSMNLVPACKCNSKRGRTLLGNLPNQRILHPYFDQCLNERLISAHITNLGPVPSVSLRLMVPNTHPQYDAIAFHTDTIVERTSIKKYLREKWIKLCRKPRLVVRELSAQISTAAELNEVLDDELENLDEEHESKNNWESIFVSGLKEPHVSSWLFQQLSRAGYTPNDPLN